MALNSEQQAWTSVIVPVKGFSFFSIHELLRFRFLITSLAIRNLKTHYFQTLIGPFWLIIQPLITSTMFIVVFNRIARIPTDGSSAFAFYFCGIILWKFFAQSVNSLSYTFVQNSHLFSKLYFPRMVMPVADMFTHCIQFSIQGAPLFLLYLYYCFVTSTVQISFFSVISAGAAVLLTALTGSGVGFICSSLTITFRDVRYLISYGMQMWFYATPIIYPASKIPEYLQGIYFFNPMVAAMELFRYPFSATLSVTGAQIIMAGALSIVLNLIGLIMFSRAEKTCVDRV